MKIMVMPITLEIGGSEINAIDLAAAVQQRGHEVIVIGRPGPLSEVAEAAGVRVLHIPIAKRGRPNPTSSRAIRQAIRREAPDLVHVYEALSCTEAHFGVGVRPRRRVPLVATLYGMNVDRYMPRVVPMIAGTRDIERDLLVRRDPASVFLLDPPVDTDANSPNLESGLRQRRAWGVGDDEELVVIVSRLDIWMKIDSLMDAIDAVDRLAAERPVCLAVVGDGPASDVLEHRAARVNQRHGRRVVHIAGHMMDPVPAYQAADVVVGMGTSILRGMSVGKPAIVVGELGYVRPVEPGTIDPFLQQGFWGLGDGKRADAELARLLAGVLDSSPAERQALGQFGRDLVVDRFGMQSSTDKLLNIYECVRAWSPPRGRLFGDSLRVPVAVAVRKLQDHLPGRRTGVKTLDTPSELGDQYVSANAFLPGSTPAGGDPDRAAPEPVGAS